MSDIGNKMASADDLCLVESVRSLERVFDQRGRLGFFSKSPGCPPRLCSIGVSTPAECTDLTGLGSQMSTAMWRTLLVKVNT